MSKNRDRIVRIVSSDSSESEQKAGRCGGVANAIKRLHLIAEDAKSAADRVCEAFGPAILDCPRSINVPAGEAEGSSHLARELYSLCADIESSLAKIRSSAEACDL